MTLLLCAALFAGGVGLIYDGLVLRQSGSDTPVRRARPWTAPLHEFLGHAGLEGVTVRGFVLVSAASGLASGLAAQVALGWPALSIAAGVLGALAPLGYYAPRRDRRRAAIQVALVEATAQLRAAIQAGLSVQQALVALAATGPEALRSEIARLILDMRLKGLVPALEDLRDRLADPIADQLVSALVLNDRVGGRQVGAVLERLAHSTRASLSVYQEAKARQSQAVLSARVVALVPASALVGLRAVAPSFMSVYDEPLGQLVLVACLIWVVLGYGAMRWMGRLPESPRVLVR
jgi:tight adherence protein B